MYQAPPPGGTGAAAGGGGDDGGQDLALGGGSGALPPQQALGHGGAGGRGYLPPQQALGHGGARGRGYLPPQQALGHGGARGRGYLAQGAGGPPQHHPAAARPGRGGRRGLVPDPAGGGSGQGGLLAAPPGRGGRRGLVVQAGLLAAPPGRGAQHQAQGAWANGPPQHHPPPLPPLPTGFGCNLEREIRQHPAYNGRLHALAVAKQVAEPVVDQLKAGFLLPQQLTVDALPQINTSAYFTSQSLLAYCFERKAHSNNICRYKIPVPLLDGSEGELSVTIDKEPTIEQRAHCIVNLLGVNIRCRVVIEEHSGYTTAFQVLIGNEDPNLVDWCLFSNSEDLPARFGLNKVRINYNLKYSKPQLTVQVNEVTTGAEILDFLASLRNDPDLPVTEEGKNLFDTLFVLLNESPRFSFIEDWLHHLGQLPAWYSTILRKWRELSEVIVQLVVYLHERANARHERHPILLSVARSSAATVRRRLARLQRDIQGDGFSLIPDVLSVHGDDVIFADPTLSLEDVSLDGALLRRLCAPAGGLVSLVKFNQTYCNTYLYRMRGYVGPM